jgi:hypothetical protein
MQTHIRIASALVAALIVSATPAQAQFGGLINKAKEKVAQQAGEKAAPVAPGEQLTDDLLSKVVNGATAADRVLAERDRQQTLRDSKNKEYSAAMEKNQPVHQAYDNANNKILDCRSASFSALDDARRAKYDAAVKARENDPAFMGKMQLVAMKYGAKIAEAQQKNDPVALQKAQTDMMKEVFGTDVFADLKKDSVATDAKCGKVPAQPAALIQEEKLRKEVSAADDSIRTLEAKAVNVGAQASGLEQIRYLQLKERALSILNKVNNRGSGKFGDEETAAVQKRKPELEKLIRAL